MQSPQREAAGKLRRRLHPGGTVAPARRRHKRSWDTFSQASSPRRVSGARVASLGQLEHGREIKYYCVQKAEKVRPEAFSVARGYLRDEHGVSIPSTEDSVPHVSDS